MKLNEIIPGIYHMQFKTQYEQNSTLLRFQEYYESPKFKGKVFTLKEFKDWYIQSTELGKKHGFNYYSYWQGFNFPSSNLKLFLKGKFDPLSKKEKEFLKIIKSINKKKFYIITTFGRAKILLDHHEIAHGLFYMDNYYKKQVRQIMKKLTTKENQTLERYLSKQMGYHKSVIEDEMQAYLLCELSGLKKLTMTANLKKISAELKKVYEKQVAIRKTIHVA
ncbi:MAG: ABC transporter ATP-binding protein [Candidatus Nanoarchaeia archaeon]